MASAPKPAVMLSPSAAITWMLPGRSACTVLAASGGSAAAHGQTTGNAGPGKRSEELPAVVLRSAWLACDLT